MTKLRKNKNTQFLILDDLGIGEEIILQEYCPAMQTHADV